MPNRFGFYDEKWSTGLAVGCEYIHPGWVVLAAEIPTCDGKRTRQPDDELRVGVGRGRKLGYHHHQYSCCCCCLLLLYIHRFVFCERSKLSPSGLHASRFTDLVFVGGARGRFSFARPERTRGEVSEFCIKFAFRMMWGNCG